MKRRVEPDTLEAWLRYIESMHPAEIELGLDRVEQVAQKGGWHRLQPTVITFAGTNGKGTTLMALEALLIAHGLNVGSYTSPHLERYNERVRINGRPVSDAVLVSAFQQVESQREGIELTYFEIGTLAALAIFKGKEEEQQEEPQGLDVILLEVGLGGRLDAVNCVDADIAVITTIDLDHTDWLGDTLEAIAREKAGVMRPDAEVLIAQIDPPDILYSHAEALGCRVIDRAHYGVVLESEERGESEQNGERGESGEAASQPYLEKTDWSSQHWSWFGISERSEQHERLERQGHEGSYVESIRLNNLPVPHIPLISAATALQLLYRLQTRYLLGEHGERGGKGYSIEKELIEKGLQQVRVKGRMSYCPGEPLPILFDIAHNRQSVAYLADRLSQWRGGAEDRQLGRYNGGAVVALFGALQDKQVEDMVALISDTIDIWVPAAAVGPRAFTAEALADILSGEGVKVMEIYPKSDMDADMGDGAIDDGIDSGVDLGIEGVTGPFRHFVSQSLTKLGEEMAGGRPIELLVVFGSFYLVGPLLSQLDRSSELI